MNGLRIYIYVDTHAYRNGLGNKVFSKEMVSHQAKVHAIYNSQKISVVPCVRGLSMKRPDAV